MFALLTLGSDAGGIPLIDCVYYDDPYFRSLYVDNDRDSIKRNNLYWNGQH